MKKTICPRCSSVNEVPPHYLGRSVSCPKCKAEYSAIEDRTGALTDKEKKRSEVSARSNTALGAALAIGIVIGIPVLLIGGCRYLVNRAETAREEKELRRAQVMAELDAKYPTRTSTSDSYQSKATEWYSGGTLHRSTMREWRQATYSDRLATAADFSATLLKKQGRSVRSMNELRPIAVALETAISEAGRGGVADTQSASSIAAATWLLLNR